MNLHPLIRWELQILESHFPGKAYLNLEEYAELFGVGRRYATQHIKRREIPYVKLSRTVWHIALVDLAKWFAQHKHKGNLLLSPTTPEEQAREAKNRRGFAKAALEKQLYG